MTTIPNELLLEHASRTQGKTVIITGGSGGFGKEIALRLAPYGAKIVVADINGAAAEVLAAEIRATKGTATAIQCDVTSWESVVDVFEHAMTTYGSVDVVVANAGVVDRSFFWASFFDKNGRLLPPDMKVLDVNLRGVINTAGVARHYLCRNHDPKSGSLKSLVMTASLASFISIPTAPLYAASKFAVLGLMRSIAEDFEKMGISVGSVHPWFADTPLIDTPTKLIIAGLPFTPVSLLADAVVRCATSPNNEDHECAWLLTDNGPVLRVRPEECNMGLYELIDAKAASQVKGIEGLEGWKNIVLDINKALHLSWWTLVLFLAGGCYMAAKRL
ncbi:hypothetical protein DL96DRAFT_1581640 [Flagelloscypha sp. PMI_526]|nr:hypothetical protein DL96DRAFT_1581640 [Flagelloscypha sp. PMI_526]